MYIYIKKYLFSKFKSLLRYGMIFWGGERVRV